MKKRILTFLISIGLFSTFYQIGALSTVNDNEAQEFLKEFKDLVDGIDATGIFIHNFTIALPMFIPGFGVVWGLFSAWSTGFAFAAITSTMPELSKIPPLAILYLSPFGMMELLAYSLGISRSFLLIHMIIKKINLRTAIRGTIIEVGIMFGLLLAGGFLEFYMIELTQKGELSMF